MTIRNIRLQNFRSYTDESFELAPGVNIIVGPNASGKSNLLEALMVVGLGKSYRARDGELVAFGADWARLDAQTETQVRTVKLVQEPGRTAKSFEIDDQKFVRLSLQKSLPIVLFEPNHLQLLSGSPELRREFVDNLLEQTVAGYPALLRQYRRTLAQRNALLKKGSQLGASQLFAWNVRLSQLGGQIVTQRVRLLLELNQGLSGLYSDLARHEYTVEAAYQSSCAAENYSSAMLRALEKNQELDFIRGFTTRGPHRDDIEVRLNDHPLQQAASRGETRTLLLALKIMELKQLEVVHGYPPLLLLDDVFSELDGARRQALTQYLRGYQTFITTTDADVVVQHFMDKCQIIPISR